MNPEQNGYLARHLQNQFFFHYYNQASVLQYGYNFVLNPVLIPHVPNSISQRSGNPLQNPLAIQVDPNSKAQRHAKRKRLVKRLPLIDLETQILQKEILFKTLKKTLNYFDPCRAPPITTLRNEAELQADLQQQLQKNPIPHDSSASDRSETQLNASKLEIILKIPNQQNYPFLICKKRKYYRNLKRRYSVTYFQQRAYFISHQMPIPFKLEPKYRNRKSRLKEMNQNDADDFSSEFQSNSGSQLEEQSENSSEKGQKNNEAQKLAFGLQQNLEVKKEDLDSAQMRPEAE